MGSDRFNSILKHYKKTKIVSGAVVLTLFVAACSSGLETHKKAYVYQDPSSGQVVELKPAHDPFSARTKSHTGEAEKKDKHSKYDFENAKIEVNIVSKIATFKVDVLKPNQSRESLEFSGRLDDSFKGWIKQTNSSKTSKKFISYIQCVGGTGESECSKLYANIYYTSGGKVETKQFIAHPGLPKIVSSQLGEQSEEGPEEDGYEIEQVGSSDTSKKSPVNAPKKTEPSKTQAQKDNVKVDEPSGPDTEPQTAAVTPPAEALDPADDEMSHGDDELSIPEENVYYVAPTLPDEYLSEIKDADEVILAPEKKQKEGDRPLAENELIQGEFPFNLDEGGRAFGSNSNGRILDQGTQLERESEGLKRISSDRKAYATGYMVDFVSEAAKVFVSQNPNCDLLTVNNMSKKGGGTLYFDRCHNGKCAHTTHKNGLDADIRYLPGTQGSVLQGGKIKASFNYQCNYDFFKYISTIQLPNGLSAVSRIIVHKKVKEGLCSWAKQKKLSSEADKQLFATLYSDRSEHDDHFHLTMRCSPKHVSCEQSDSVDTRVTCTL